MSTKSKSNSLYQRAGIDDLAEFYRVRYASDELLDARYFDSLNRFDIRWARTMWVYDNVRRGASVLDLGCGAGVLGLLKRKAVTLVGIDLAQDCARAARRNGYDQATVGELTHLPYADDSFDYVVSLDVMGHVEFEQKDRLISEIKRVLKPDGVTLHGIECLDKTKRKDYEQMTAEELRRYVQTDGHVGMEDQLNNTNRFAAFFKNVDTRFRFVVCQSHSEFLKQSDDYERPYCDPDFLGYLRQMSFKERKAFDMAMGFIFDKISEGGIKLPQSEYLFLKASAAELGSFYNEHRDRSDLQTESSSLAQAPQLLDFSPQAAFDAGWYPAESFPPIARWMGERAAVTFFASSVSKLRLQLQSHLPSIETQPVTLRFFLNGVELNSLMLDRYGWVEIEIDAGRRGPEIHNAGDQRFTFEIRANRVWRPKLVDQSSTDDRDLSIAVCNIEVFS